MQECKRQNSNYFLSMQKYIPQYGMFKAKCIGHHLIRMSLRNCLWNEASPSHGGQWMTQVLQRSGSVCRPWQTPPPSHYTDTWVGKKKLGLLWGIWLLLRETNMAPLLLLHMHTFVHHPKKDAIYCTCSKY